MPSTPFPTAAPAAAPAAFRPDATLHFVSRCWDCGTRDECATEPEAHQLAVDHNVAVHGPDGVPASRPGLIGRVRYLVRCPGHAVSRDFPTGPEAGRYLADHLARHHPHLAPGLAHDAAAA